MNNTPSTGAVSGTTPSGAATGNSGTTNAAGSGTTGSTGSATGNTSSGSTTGTGTAGAATGNATAPTAATTGATGGGAYVPAGKGSVDASDRNLMRELAYTNISEIETAKLAQSKSKNDEVLNFARQMIDDHTKALDQLQQLAQQKGVQLPTEPDAKHKALAKKLTAMSGDNFDREYLAKAGLSDHSQAHKLVTRVKGHAHDADLKQLAITLQPGIDHHLQMAKSLKSGTQTSSSTSTGK